MILVDTSVWASHFDRNDAQLSILLETDRVLMHPFVVGEIMMGNVVRREKVMAWFSRMPVVLPVRHAAVMVMVNERELFGSGLSYVDAHLLAATLTVEGCRLWTRDKALACAVDVFGLAADFK